LDVALELVERYRGAPDLPERRVAPPDAAHRAAPALDLEGQRRRRGDGGVSRAGVRDAGAELDPVRVARGQHQLAPHFRRDVLRVGEDQTVEAQALRHARELGGPTRRGKQQQPEFHRTTLYRVRRPAVIQDKIVMELTLVVT